MIDKIFCLFVGAIILTIGLLLGIVKLWRNNPPSFSAETILVLTASTLLLFYFLRSPKYKTDFVRNYLASIVFKITIGMIYIFIVFKLDVSGADQNAIFFILSYILFTILEIIGLYIVNKQK